MEIVYWKSDLYDRLWNIFIVILFLVFNDNNINLFLDDYRNFFWNFVIVKVMIFLIFIFIDMILVLSLNCGFVEN